MGKGGAKPLHLLICGKQLDIVNSSGGDVGGF